MGRLFHNLCYLIGPMDDPKADRGYQWRAELSPWLQSHGIGVLNPFDLIENGDDDYAYRTALREEGRYDELEPIMQNIVSMDLHFVDISNFCIMQVRPDTHMCGSYNEQTYAALEKKPVIIFCPEGKNKIPLWLYGMGMRHQMFFSSVEEVKDYVNYINYDEAPDTLGRWRFIDYQKVFGDGILTGLSQ